MAVNIKAINESLDKAEEFLISENVENFFLKNSENIILNIRKNIKSLVKNNTEKEIRKYISISNNSDFERSIYNMLIHAYVFGFYKGVGETKRKNKKRKFDEKGTDEIYRIIEDNRKLLNRLSLIKQIPGKDTLNTFFNPSKASLDFLKSYTVKLAGIQQEVFLRRVTEITKKSIEKGLSEKESYELLINDLGKLPEELKKFSRVRMKMVARTEATRAFNIGNLDETYNSDIVIGYQFEAVLDRNTTDICRSRWGKFIKKEDTVTLAKNTPPLHVNCRSFLRTITEYEKNILDKNKINTELKQYLWNPDETGKKIVQSNQREEDKNLLLDLLNKWKNENINYDKIIIETKKLTNYLLNTEHTEGGAKAKFLRELGYNKENWEEFYSEIMMSIKEAEVISEDLKIKFITEIGKENKKEVTFIFKKEKENIRLVTMIPKAKR